MDHSGPDLGPKAHLDRQAQIPTDRIESASAIHRRLHKVAPPVSAGQIGDLAATPNARSRRQKTTGLGGRPRPTANCLHLQPRRPGEDGRRRLAGKRRPDHRPRPSPTTQPQPHRWRWSPRPPPLAPFGTRGRRHRGRRRRQRRRGGGQGEGELAMGSGPPAAPWGAPREGGLLNLAFSRSDVNGSKFCPLFMFPTTAKMRKLASF
jgi:hypothetical protein